MTYDELRRELDTLRGLKFPPPDYQTHWTALQDMTLASLHSAVVRAAKECQTFPTPAELRDMVNVTVSRPEGYSEPLDVPKQVSAPFLSKPITITREWIYYCEDCSDSGWTTFWCGASNRAQKPWQIVRACERRGDHGPHEWVARCHCYERNHAVQQRVQDQSERAAKRTERKVS